MTNRCNDKYNGIVFFDIDGTLVDERLGIYRPTSVVVDALNKLKKNGYAVGLATGRAKPYLPDLGFSFDCYVTSNGAVAEYKDTVVANEVIPPEKMVMLTEYFNKNNIACSCENREQCYYGSSNVDMLKDTLVKFNIKPETFKPMGNPEKTIANKFICVFERSEDFEKTKKDLNNDFLISRHHNGNSADVDIIGINKSVGMAAIIDFLGISQKDTYAFGDDVNDIDMLKFAGCGIAMTPHAEELEEVADEFTTGVKDNGTAVALKRLGLI